MSHDKGSIAPKERINIRYIPATMGQTAETELPLRLVVLGNFLGKYDSTPLEERQMLRIDRASIHSVMEEAGLETQLSVSNVLSETDENENLSVSLKFSSLKDFEPDALVDQVPELQKLMQLRDALMALRGPLGNTPAFRRRVQQILDDETTRNQLLRELRIEN